MFDLTSIKFIKGSQRDRLSYSFVGIQKNCGEDKNLYPLEFWLPLGFDDFDCTDFSKVKSFFFLMYRTFKKYLQSKLNGLNDDEKNNKRDGVYQTDGGFSFTREDNEQVVLYAKINALDKILEGYDELIIASLEQKYHRSTQLDYSKIYKYLHQSIYLDDDVIYLDEMNIAKEVIIEKTPPIIQLFCYLFIEIKKELSEIDTVSNKAIEQSELFKEHYLNIDSGLFDKDTFNETIKTLKEAFDEIDNASIYKDSDYWHFYEAIEAFLYGENDFSNTSDIYWGISNFYDIWENMCQVYVLNNKDLNSVYTKNLALFADNQGYLMNLKNITNNPFKMTMNNEEKERFLRPDLVVIKQIDFGGEQIFDKIFKSADKVLIKDKPASIFRISFEKNINTSLPQLLAVYNRYLSKNPYYQEDKRLKEYKGVLSKDFNEFKRELSTEIYNLPLDKLFDYKPSLLTSIGLIIVDYKYMSEYHYQNYDEQAFYEKSTDKVKNDIKKQLIYEWTVQKNMENSNTESEFWIPHYLNSEKATFAENKLLVMIKNDKFNESKISIFKINFMFIQKFYLEL